eukprot:TRINITY_DN7390_c0_g1_i1.p1 TRINITY_DN7390_c0_g1~~TRINITY_DN7390_c0_g1_i1.p1  ORF type:complete len:645 (-),score=151.26 TRINITY_DN7390_c0_g1_i1:94-2028(-)
MINPDNQILVFSENVTKYQYSCIAKVKSSLRINGLNDWEDIDIFQVLKATNFEVYEAVSRIMDETNIPGQWKTRGKKKKPFVSTRLTRNNNNSRNNNNNNGYRKNKKRNQNKPNNFRNKQDNGLKHKASNKRDGKNANTKVLEDPIVDTLDNIDGDATMNGTHEIAEVETTENIDAQHKRAKIDYSSNKNNNYDRRYLGGSESLFIRRKTKNIKPEDRSSPKDMQVELEQPIEKNSVEEPIKIEEASDPDTVEVPEPSDISPKEVLDNSNSRQRSNSNNAQKNKPKPKKNNTKNTNKKNKWRKKNQGVPTASANTEKKSNILNNNVNNRNSNTKNNSNVNNRNRKNGKNGKKSNASLKNGNNSNNSNSMNDKTNQNNASTHNTSNKNNGKNQNNGSNQGNGNDQKKGNSQNIGTNQNGNNQNKGSNQNNGSKPKNGGNNNKGNKNRNGKRNARNKKSNSMSKKSNGAKDDSQSSGVLLPSSLQFEQINVEFGANQISPNSNPVPVNVPGNIGTSNALEQNHYIQAELENLTKSNEEMHRYNMAQGIYPNFPFHQQPYPYGIPPSPGSPIPIQYAGFPMPGYHVGPNYTGNGVTYDEESFKGYPNQEKVVNMEDPNHQYYNVSPTQDMMFMPPPLFVPPHQYGSQ